MGLFAKITEPYPRRDKGIRPFTNEALKAMIIPLLVEQLLQVVVGIADTLMVSYAGEATVRALMNLARYRQGKWRSLRVI